MPGAPTTTWAPAVDRAEGPLYLAIAEAIAADIASGRLAPGQRLPPQRSLAQRLGIDFTTVSRAYAEAARRGLVEGRVGQGTYVRRRAAAPLPAASGLVDMSMNLPPRFADLGLEARLWEGVAGLEQDGGMPLLLRYQEPGGSGRDREAGLAWIAPRLPQAEAARLLLCPGAQGALLTVFSLITQPGDAVAAEALTYPGFRALAAHLGLRLLPVAMDAEGLLPDAFDVVCRAEKPKALYCTPTLQNPTTATLPLARREKLVAIARHHGVPIVEDDAYGALPAAPLPPLAALAPERVFHIAGLAKCLSPALRIAYLLLPDATLTARAAGALRATAGMASPLGAGIATRWIEQGTAVAIRDALRAEAGARQAILAEALSGQAFVADSQGFHAWLPLPAPWSRGAFLAELRAAGIGAVASDAFALATPPEALRLGLGAAEGRGALRQGLAVVAQLLRRGPDRPRLVV
ncbi:PLP-dependent aminotransferase family protein [Roseomonas sp. 18066]|uniref:aminotransferase-like domain-containing protein n=1 Tax=Roseomonas sp. 18066 TaxID=2681412 RepID=UPI0013573DC6|nr:PLP-dependent aminotransferase family protein [Roseomonas sp. 18066]